MNTDKVALVTGTNKGLGLEITRQLAQTGVTVLLGARDPERGRDAAQTLSEQGLSVYPLALDVTDDRSLQAAAAQIDAEFGRLDILVNNAGIYLEHAPPSATSPDALRRTFDTNFFGVFAVTQALLPLLRKSAAGRIVNMSSGMGSLAQNSDPQRQFAGVKPLAYNASKAALNMMTVVFAAELRDTSIKINAAAPGYTATELNGFQGTRTVEEGAREPVRLALLDSDGPTGGFFSDDGPVPW